MSTTHFAMGIVCLFTFGQGCPWQDDGPWQQGDGPWQDDGLEPSDGVDEPCTWDLDDSEFPIYVWAGLAVFGEIAFDGNCDLIVGGGEDLPYVDALHRVSKEDGSVSVLVPIGAMPDDSLVISGITHRAIDDRIYFTVNIADGPDWLYAVDDQDQLHPILVLDKPIHSLSVAPDNFGPFGGQLIAVQYSPTELLAIDVDAEDPEQAVTSFASSTNSIPDAVFGNDGTLYVAERGVNRIATVTPDGVFEEFYASSLGAPGGLALSPDGSRMFIAHVANWVATIHELSIADATVIQHDTFEVGGLPVGMVVDGANRVFYTTPLENHAVVESFSAQ